MKSLTLFQLLFAAASILKIANVEPFTDWAWWIICLLLLFDVVFSFVARAVNESQLMKIFWAEIALSRYNILLKRETNKFKKKLKEGGSENAAGTIKK